MYTVCTVYEMVFTEHPDFIYYPLCLQSKTNPQNLRCHFKRRSAMQSGVLVFFFLFDCESVMNLSEVFLLRPECWVEIIRNSSFSK